MISIGRHIESSPGDWQIIRISVLTIFILFFGGPVFAQPAGYTGSEFTGAEGVGNSISPATGGNTSILRSTSWTDVEFNCTNISTSQGAMSAAVVFRYTNTSAYYAVTYEYNWGGNYVTRLKSNNHQADATTGDIATYTSASPTTSMKITAEGTAIKVWINGTLRIDVTNSTHTTGSVGFIKTHTWNVNTVSWSNVSWAQIISAVPPTISTTAMSSITSTTASSGGNTISDGGGTISAKGVCWNTSTGPTTSNSTTSDGTGTSDFSSSLTGLSPATTYYVRAYATNEAGTSYGNEVSFTTDPVVPTLTTTAASSINCTTASSGGNISSNGGAAVTARGVCWNTGGSPTTANSSTSDGSGTGAFASSITGLSAGTTYYVRAYATNSAGTAYGNEISFTTDDVVSAGTIGSPQTICHNTVPATLTNVASASNGTGSYGYQWQSSPDNSSWSDIGGATSATYSPAALTANTYYRRGVTSGDCGTSYTASVLITVDPASVGGSISAAATECYGSNGATLTLSGHTGNVVKWQYSTDNWSTPIDIVNTNNTQTYSNLTATTKYRAVVQSGSCSSTNSSDVTITVNPQLTPGSIRF